MNGRAKLFEEAELRAGICAEEIETECANVLVHAKIIFQGK